MGKYAQNRIREIRKQKGFTLERLAHAVCPDVALTTISKLESGTMALSLDWIKKIAVALDVSPFEIIGVDHKPIRMIPVLGDISAGNWRESIENPNGFVPIPEGRFSPRCFALRADGDSMNRVVADGGFVVIDPDDVDLVDRRVYAVLNSLGETTIKSFRLDPPRLEPCSTNANHKTIPVGQEMFVVIGRAVYTGGFM
jgi:repressor LexA